MENFVPAFKPLTTSNWAIWKNDIQILLLHYNCKDFLTKDVPPPAKRLDGDGKPLVDPSPKEVSDHNTRKIRAYTLLYANISDELKPLIQNTTDAKEAWSILGKQFEPVNKSRVLKLWDNFLETKYQEGENIGLFLCRVKSVIQQLRDVGHEIPNFYQVAQVVRWLPRQYKSIIESIYKLSDEDFNLLKVEPLLIDGVSQVEAMEEDFEKSETFYYVGRPSTSRGEPPSERRGRSYRRDSSRRGRKKWTSRIQSSDESSQERGKQNFKLSSFKNKKSGHFSKNYNQSTDSDSSMNRSSIRANVRCFQCNRYGHFKKDCKYVRNYNELHFCKSGFGYAELDFCSLLENDSGLEVNSAGKPYSDEWLVDSGATGHFCCNRDLFIDLNPVSNMQMSLAVNNDVKIEGKGTVEFQVKCDGKIQTISLRNVFYSPKLRRNLISATKLECNGCTFIGKNGSIVFYNKYGSKLFKAFRRNNLYFLRPFKYTFSKTIEVVHSEESEIEPSSSSFFSKNQKLSELWHNRFCHINAKYVVNTRHGVRGLPKFSEFKKTCVPCKLTKSRSVSFKPIDKIRSKKPLALLHMDLCYIPDKDYKGNKYFMSIVDDYSRKCTVFPLKSKSDVFNTYLRFHNRAERFLGRKIKCVRTDGGLEFVNREFGKLFDELGVRHERTNIYTPQQNGVAERYNSTCLNAIRAMLRSAEFPNRFWSEAILCFNYVQNRTVHKNFSKTPIELYSGNKPSVRHFKIFGCLAFVNIPRQLRKKLDDKARLGIMCGYAFNTRGYRIYLKEENKIIETVNVTFDETISGYTGSKLGIGEEIKKRVRFDLSKNSDSEEEGEGDVSFQSSLRDQFSLRSTSSDESDSETEVKPISCDKIKWTRLEKPRSDRSRTDVYYGIEGQTLRLRSHNDVEKYCKSHGIQFDKNMFDFSDPSKKRPTEMNTNIQPPNLDEDPQIPDADTNAVPQISDKDTDAQQEVNFIDVNIPRFYEEAINSPEADRWKKAMEDELRVMLKRKVWDLVLPPENTKVVGNRWVYSLKKIIGGKL